MFYGKTLEKLGDRDNALLAYLKQDGLNSVEQYIDAEYIELLETDREKEEEVASLILSLFKLQVHMNVKTESIYQILEQFKKTGIPFSDLFFKVWTCLSDPDSIDAQRYLSDKAIAELIEQVKKKGVAGKLERANICFDFPIWNFKRKNGRKHRAERL